MALSFLLCTIGRPSLPRMVDSIITQIDNDDKLYIAIDGKHHENKVKSLVTVNDRITYIVNNETLGFWGHGLRNKYQSSLDGDYILHCDDDDIYLPGAIENIKHYLDVHRGHLLFFKMYLDHHQNRSVWRTPEIKFGNIGTPCGIVPNIPEKMGVWGNRHGGDCDFFATCKFQYKFIDKHIYCVKP